MRLAFCLIFAIFFYSVSAFAGNKLETELAKAAPDINTEVLSLAVQSMICATSNGMASSQRMAVIDYSIPSTEPRLWVFDLGKKSLLYRELVAHGRNTGENFARNFSNRIGSFESSVGLYQTGETYQGENGYSLRMNGLEPGFNDKAMERAIVMHGAPYVDEAVIEKLGRLGRSLGCPAVSNGVARQVIDALKGGQFVFSYYPDSKWLSASHLLNCRTTVAMLEGESRHQH